MSDIPIGSPPVPPGRHAAPGGWYPDPVDARSERYWDGWQWSRTTRPIETANPSGVHPYPGPRAQAPMQPGAGQPPGQPYGGQPYYGQQAAAQSGSTQAVATADGVPLAGWGTRLAALLLDTVVVYLLIQLVSLPLAGESTAAMQTWLDEATRTTQAGGPVDFQQLFATYPLRELLVSVAIGLVVTVAYHAVLLRWKSATVGKLLLKLRVVPVDHGAHQGQLGWSTIALRVGLWVVGGQLIFVFRLLDGLFPLWQPKRQAIHDLAAKTQVIVRR